ncbi:hypothetical protein [Marinobacter sp. SS8-8]|uniref:hypothetical protein n=1 Tax=Marinobacter sp. SS8-8 TaxID=3050452 RepID=UPI0026DEDAE5|nr:hypothetical protein [Marinobacter sp. SS8-8]
MLIEPKRQNNENDSHACPEKSGRMKFSGFLRFVIIASFLISGACFAASLETGSGKMDVPVTVRIDNAIEYQEMAGFGATTLAGIMLTPNGPRDMLGATLRHQAIKAVYHDVGLTLGSLELWLEPANDNNDPMLVNKDGFQWETSNAMHDLLVRPARAYGFSNYSLGLKIDMRRELRWMEELRERDYSRYLQEVAEYVAAGVSHWQEITGAAPRLITLFNEPLSGNRELRGGSKQEVVDIIKSAGERLRAEGFARTRFIVPAEETVAKSIDTIESILADEDARSHIGALAYHAYPYDSAYSSVRRILQTSGRGLPDHEEVRVRQRIYELAARYDIPVWMTETSEGPGRADYPFGSPENLRARANHIHDELVYANASAYFAMYDMWDRQSHDAHFSQRGIDFFSESSHIVLIDQKTSEVHISGIGYAIGHFARWITPGLLRIDAVSDNKLVKVVAFRSNRNNELVLVIINNGDFEADIDVSLENMGLRGAVNGEYSDTSNRWKKLAPLTPLNNTRFRLTVSPVSVTSLSTGIIELNDLPSLPGVSPARF